MLSTTPAVILPVPSAVKEPTAARKLDSAVYPLRMKAYWPLRSDSLPESVQAAAALMAKLNASFTLWWVGKVESVTVNVKLTVAVAVGVPEIVQLVPEPLIDNHDGSDEPDATLQV